MPIGTRGRTLALPLTLVLAAAASTLASLPGCGQKRPGEGEEGSVGCLSNKRYFERQVWSAFMGSKCTKCHTPDGVAVAENNAKLVLQPPSYPGFLDANLRTLSDVINIEYAGKSEILQKPIGQLAHGGGQVIAADGPEFKALTELVARLKGGEVCADPGSTALDGVKLLDNQTTLRKAAIDLGGRLPTPEEMTKVSSNKEADLDAVLDQLVTEPVFYERLREMFNDLYLTDKFLEYGGAALNFLDEKQYPSVKPWKDGNSPEYKDETKRSGMNRAIAREPLEMVVYVVKNDRPFTEIVTANYALVNPYSALAYGVSSQVQFPDPNDASDFREAKVTLGTGVAVPHAGILSMPTFLNRWQTTPTNRNRARARRVFSFFLATDVLKIAERPVDATKVTEEDNPTHNSIYCNVCHRVIDPVAGAFRGWDDFNYEDFDPQRKWHDEMYEPGFNGDKMPPSAYGAGVQWLGQQVAQDPRFAISAIYAVYTGLTGHKPMTFPNDPTVPEFEKVLEAWEAQDQFFSRVADAFKKSNYNLKTVVKAVIKSPYYRGEATPGGDPTLLKDVGTGRFLTPEMMHRKIKAVLGASWVKQYEIDKQHTWLRDDYELIYGGIDSDNVPTRLTEPNGIVSSVAWRMANEMACHVTAYDFTFAKDGRRFFTMADEAEVPEAAGHTVDGSVANIKKNIVYLHQLVLGETLDVKDPEIERTYQVFYGTWKELSDTHASGVLPYECQGRIDPNTGKELQKDLQITKDNLYTIRSWQAVMTYLLLDYKFLYHLPATRDHTRITMERRRFMQVAGLTGLAVMAPTIASRRASAASKYAGPYFISIHAGGGWDPTLFCDPKGGAVNALFTKEQAASSKVGAFNYAPIDYSPDVGNMTKKLVYSNKQFFESHYQRFMIINGLDTTTNNHDSGTRTVWSGQMAEGYPALSAMMAGIKTKDGALPMAFLSNGGYDATQGLVSLTRAGSIDSLRRLAYPNRTDPNKSDSATYHSPDTLSRISQAQMDRLTAMKGGAKLPVLQHAMGSLYLARQGNDGLDVLASALEAQKVVDLDNIPDLKGIGNLGDLEGLMQQGQLALVAFQAGVAVSANLSIGGYDTHGDHDNRHIPQMMKLLRALDYIYTSADQMGIGQNLYVMVGSDFGRTPVYNKDKGKDHWNVTSMLLSGPGITGNRLVGKSTDEFKPMSFDPGTLQPAEGGSAVRIETKHVHRALRKLLGLTGTEADKQFPIPGEDLPLFGLPKRKVTVGERQQGSLDGPSRGNGAGCGQRRERKIAPAFLASLLVSRPTARARTFTARRWRACGRRRRGRGGRRYPRGSRRLGPCRPRASADRSGAGPGPTG